MAVVKINPKGLNNNETAQFLEDGAFDRSQISLLAFFGFLHPFNQPTSPLSTQGISISPTSFNVFELNLLTR